MHVYLTGATGFVGSYILRTLVARGHTVRCLLRDKADPLSEDAGVERVKGDITDANSLTGTMRGCDAVIHLVGIIDETPSKDITFERIHVDGTRHVVDEARESGIERFIHMSANGARADGVAAYQRTKWEAEAYVRAAGFDHTTVFRPSIIFGEPMEGQPEFCTQLARDLVGPFPILPVFGDGQYRLQPIAVEDVAAAFVQALDTPAARGTSYCAAGPVALSYVDVLDVIARAMGGEPKPKLPQPIWLVRPLIQAAGVFDLLPISPDQFEMLIDGNTCDNAALVRDFDLALTPFDEDHLGYLRG